MKNNFLKSGKLYILIFNGKKPFPLKNIYREESHIFLPPYLFLLFFHPSTPFHSYFQFFYNFCCKESNKGKLICNYWFP